jgi:hypothetical protein
MKQLGEGSNMPELFKYIADIKPDTHMHPTLRDTFSLFKANSMIGVWVWFTLGFGFGLGMNLCLDLELGSGLVEWIIVVYC